MDIRQLTPQFFVAPQIDPAQIELLNAQGFTMILCNRPDGEVPASHSADAMQTAATAAGIRFAYLPLTHQTMTLDVIDENRALTEGPDEKVLAYCASGTRSCIAWALGQRGKQSADALLLTAQKAGYNLDQLRAVLRAAENGVKT